MVLGYVPRAQGDATPVNIDRWRREKQTTANKTANETITERAKRAPPD